MLSVDINVSSYKDKFKFKKELLCNKRLIFSQYLNIDGSRGSKDDFANMTNISS